jgi:hypothetical protein
MATLIAQTEWHGNPRPVLAYASSLEDGLVASPYYIDQRDVPVHDHIVTSVPLGDLTPTAVIDIAGPLAAVEFTLGGVYVTGKILNITIVRTTAPDYVTSFIAPTATLGADFATEVALGISKELDMSAVNVDGTVTVTAVLPVTALTITVLTIT